MQNVAIESPTKLPPKVRCAIEKLPHKQSTQDNQQHGSRYQLPHLYPNQIPAQRCQFYASIYSITSVIET